MLASGDLRARLVHEVFVDSYNYMKSGTLIRQVINRINQKHRRPEDAPVPLSALTPEEQALIRKHYPDLF
jgi:hypothetical protein